MSTAISRDAYENMNVNVFILLFGLDYCSSVFNEFVEHVCSSYNCNQICWEILSRLSKYEGICNTELDKNWPRKGESEKPSGGLF